MAQPHRLTHRTSQVADRPADAVREHVPKRGDSEILRMPQSREEDAGAVVALGPCHRILLRFALGVHWHSPEQLVALNGQKKNAVQPRTDVKSLLHAVENRVAPALSMTLT
jgi:hypothetical protein